ncbi:ketohydroxyglutarate aldolase [Sphingobium sp. HBC34]|uniref:Ketohydroxyglutarate aldolase n=1 Tax=Sphingobium cyanobacteriorum TaxID=3063954 RepID=A0ABT8ZM59_9SPHN|nr:ketohydroxyglutarate aldolase [Sphingobium sp. HBC34]MDO7835473.1 ketohydroxyglutarate aldolase [Sphingobium sp. HBC34]
MMRRRILCWHRCARSIEGVAEGVATGTGQRHHGWRYRANVALRILTGTIGAYLVAALAAAMLARTLPMSRAEATVTATMIAYLVAPGVTIWAFLARGPWRALAGVVMAALVLGGGVWLAGARA